MFFCYFPILALNNYERKFQGLRRFWENLNKPEEMEKKFLLFLEHDYMKTAIALGEMTGKFGFRNFSSPFLLIQVIQKSYCNKPFYIPEILVLVVFVSL